MRSTKATTVEAPETAPAPPAELIPLAHLVVEGLAESVDALAAQLDDISVDDIGRRCTSRETARRLFAERAEAEERARIHHAEQQEQVTRRHAEALAAVVRGMPVPEGLADLSALEVMLSGAHAGRLDEAGKRYEEYAGGDLTFHPLPSEDA